MQTDRLPKIAFIISLCAIAFLYGFAAHGFGWFPASFIERAWQQARALEDTRPAFISTPRVYDRSGVRAPQQGEMQPGVTLVSTIWPDYGWKPGLALLDREGNFLHRWKADATEIFQDTTTLKGKRLSERSVHGSHLFPNGDVLAVFPYIGIARLDACGEIEWTVKQGIHHSVTKAADGSFWTVGVTEDSTLSSSRYPDGYPGLEGPIWHDLLIRLSPDGEVLQTVKILDVLYRNGLERYIFKSGHENTKDVTHTNDVEPLRPSMADEYPQFEAGDLVVSLRREDLVFVVDPDSWDVKWHAADPFIGQHDPDFIGDGWIGVFDNRTDGTERGTALGGSRIVAVEPATDSVRVLFPTSESEPFYTSAIGKWQMLENGNMLLAEGYAGRAVEVDSKGETVWEWVAPAYDENSVPEVTEATRYGLTPEEISRWPCSDR